MFSLENVAAQVRLVNLRGEQSPKLVWKPKEEGKHDNLDELWERKVAKAP